MVERLAVNQDVTGSSPVAGASPRAGCELSCHVSGSLPPPPLMLTEFPICTSILASSALILQPFHEPENQPPALATRFVPSSARRDPSRPTANMLRPSAQVRIPLCSTQAGYELRPLPYAAASVHKSLPAKKMLQVPIEFGFRSHRLPCWTRTAWAMPA